MRHLRVAIAAVALMLVLASPATARVEGNACSGCHEQSNLECGVTLSFIIDSCCGNWVDGYAQCVGGYGYAVVCETERQCWCGSDGQGCDVVRMSN